MAATKTKTTASASSALGNLAEDLQATLDKLGRLREALGPEDLGPVLDPITYDLSVILRRLNTLRDALED